MHAVTVGGQDARRLDRVAIRQEPRIESDDHRARVRGAGRGRSAVDPFVGRDGVGYGLCHQTQVVEGEGVGDDAAPTVGAEMNRHEIRVPGEESPRIVTPCGSSALSPGAWRNALGGKTQDTRLRAALRLPSALRLPLRFAPGCFATLTMSDSCDQDASWMHGSRRLQPAAPQPRGFSRRAERPRTFH